MNEDLLRDIYKNLGFEGRGINYDEFKSDMNDPDLQKDVYNNGGFKGKGIEYDEYLTDLGIQQPKPTTKAIKVNTQGNGVSRETQNYLQKLIPTEQTQIETGPGVITTLNLPKVSSIKKEIKDINESAEYNDRGLIVTTQRPKQSKTTINGYSWDSGAPIATSIAEGEFRTTQTKGQSKTEDEVKVAENRALAKLQKEDELKSNISVSLQNQNIDSYIKDDVYEDFEGTVAGNGGDDRALYETLLDGADVVAEDIKYVVDYNSNRLKEEFGDRYIQYIEDSKTAAKGSEESKQQFFNKYQDILDHPLTEEIYALQGKYEESNTYKDGVKAELLKDPAMQALYYRKEQAKKERNDIKGALTGVDVIDSALDVLGRNTERFIGRTTTMAGGLLSTAGDIIDAIPYMDESVPNFFRESSGQIIRSGVDLQELNPKSDKYNALAEEYIVRVGDEEVVFENEKATTPSYIRKADGNFKDITKQEEFDKYAELTKGKERSKESNWAVYTSMIADTMLDIIPIALTTKNVSGMLTKAGAAVKTAEAMGTITAGFTQVKGSALEELMKIKELTQDQREGISTILSLGIGTLSVINPMESKLLSGEASQLLKSYISKNAVDIASGKIGPKAILANIAIDLGIGGLKAGGKETFEEGTQQGFERNIVNPIVNKIYGTSLQEGTSNQEWESVVKVSLIVGSFMDVAGNVTFKPTERSQIQALTEIISKPDLYNAYIEGMAKTNPSQAAAISNVIKPIVEEISTLGADIDVKTKTEIASKMLVAAKLEQEIEKIKNPVLKKQKENTLNELYKEITEIELGKKTTKALVEEIEGTPKEGEEVKPPVVEEVDTELVTDADSGTEVAAAETENTTEEIVDVAPEDVTTPTETLVNETPTEMVAEEFDDVEIISDYNESPATYKGEAGIVRKDGQTWTFETPTTIYDLSEVNDTTSLKDAGIQIADKVTLTEDGSFSIREKEYTNMFSDPTSAITLNEDGTYTVRLDTKGDNPQPRNFRGQLAEDLAYQITLQKITKEDAKGFEEYINNADANGEIQSPATEATTRTNAEVPSAKKPRVKSAPQATKNTQPTQSTTPTEKVASAQSKQATEPSSIVTTTLPGGKIEKTFIKQDGKWFVTKKDGSASKTEVKKTEYVSALNSVQENSYFVNREQGVESKQGAAQKDDKTKQSPNIPAPQLVKELDTAEKRIVELSKEYPNASNNRKKEIQKEVQAIRDKYKFSILGEKGAAALDQAEEANIRLNNLAVAREMEVKGKDAKTIKITTGWEKGADGKYRLETGSGKMKQGVDLTKEGLTLRDIYVNEELFKAYPQLSTMPVRLVNFAPDINGGFNIKENTIDLNKNKIEDALYRRELPKTLEHETTHIVQQIEGFNRGGSSAEFLRGIYNRLDDNTGGNEEYGNGIEETPEFKRTFERAIAGPFKTDFRDLKEERNTNRRDIFARAMAEQMYEQLAGEVEARNVEERFNDTPEQRRQTLLQETEDVARKDQIVIIDAFNNTALSKKGTNDIDFDSILSNLRDLKQKVSSESTTSISAATDTKKTVLESLGKTRKEIVGQIKKFFVKDIKDITPEQATKLAEANFTMWDAVANTLSGTKGLQAAIDYMRSKVAQIGVIATADEARTMGSSKFQFIQRLFSKDQEESKAAAEDLLSKGADRDNVFSLTGWYKTDAGDLVYEVENTKTNQKFVDAFNESANFAEDQSKTYDITDLMGGELFNIYPELKDFKIKFIGDTIGNKEGGYTDFDNKEIGIRYNAAKSIAGLEASTTLQNGESDGKQLLGAIVTHELQHALQFIDGRDTGAGNDAGLDKARAEIAANLRERGILDNLSQSEQEARVDDELQLRYGNGRAAGYLEYRKSPAESEARVTQLRDAEGRYGRTFSLTEDFKKDREDVYTEMITKSISRGEKDIVVAILAQADKDTNVSTEKYVELENLVNSSGIKFSAAEKDADMTKATPQMANRIVNNAIEHLKELNKKGLEVLRAEKDPKKKDDIRKTIVENNKVIAHLVKAKKDPKFSVEPYNENVEIINGFYSPLEKIIAETKADKLPVKQWVDKFGKGEEAKWTGLTDWLNQQTGSVSKADIQKYLKENRIEIVEVVKGDVDTEIPLDGSLFSEIKTGENISNNGLFKVIKEFGEPSKIYYIGEGKELMVNAINGLGNINGSIEAYINKPKNRQQTDDTKFSQYQLEGDKENYKEVLVTLPNLEFDRLKQKMTTKYPEWAGSGKHFEKVFNEEDTKIFRNALEARNKNGFTSSHFDEPNILVHLRMNTRTDVDGNKVLFLEEVQSDWGQQGKKGGFSLTSEEKSRLIREHRNVLAELQDIDTKIIENVESGNKDKSAYDLAQQKIKLQEKSDKLRVQIFGVKTPQAPFVTDTNAWTKLALKVALKEAVKQGVNKIAWTTGEQQNDRYDLRKQVDEVNYYKTDSGNYHITADKNGSSISSGIYKESELEGILGKEVAKKIIDNEGEAVDKYNSVFGYNEYGGNQKYKSLTGDNLAVGGKGMKGFYGSPTEGSLGIVGNVAKSLFKQEPKTIVIGGGIKYIGQGSLSYKANSSIDDYEFDEITKSQLKKRLLKEGYGVSFDEFDNVDKFWKIKKDGDVANTQHSIDITPELKAQVEKGLPKFAKDAEVYRGVAIALASGQNIVAALESPAPTTFAHEAIFHSTIEPFLETDPEAKQTFIDEYNDQFGTDKKDWDTDVSERTARVYEKYLSNGRVLTSKEVKDPGIRKRLNEAFEAFTNFMKDIIINYKGKNIEVSPAAQAYFDKITGIDTAQPEATIAETVTERVTRLVDEDKIDELKADVGLDEDGFTDKGVPPKLRRYARRALNTPSISEDLKKAIMEGYEPKEKVSDEEIQAFADAFVDVLQTEEELLSAVPELLKSFSNKIAGGVNNVGPWELRAIKQIDKILNDQHSKEAAAEVFRTLDNVFSQIGGALREAGINNEDSLFIQLYGRTKRTEEPIFNAESSPESGVTNEQVFDSIIEMYEQATAEVRQELRDKIAEEIRKSKPKAEFSKDTPPSPPKLSQLLNAKANAYLESYNRRTKTGLTSGFDIEALQDYALYAFYKSLGSLTKAKEILVKKFGKDVVDENWDTLNSSPEFIEANIDIARQKLLAAIETPVNNKLDNRGMTPSAMIISSIKRKLSKESSKPKGEKKSVEEILNSKDIDIRFVTELRADIKAGLLSLDDDTKAETMNVVDSLLITLMEDKLDTIAAPWVSKTKTRNQVKENLDKLYLTIDDLVKDIVTKNTVVSSLSEEFIQRTGLTKEQSKPYLDIIKKNIDELINKRVESKLSRLFADSYGKNIEQIDKALVETKNNIQKDKKELEEVKLALDKAKKNNDPIANELTTQRDTLLSKIKSDTDRFNKLKSASKKGLKFIGTAAKNVSKQPTIEKIGDVVRNGGLSRDSIREVFSDSIGAKSFTPRDASTLRDLFTKFDNAQFDVDKENALEEISSFVFAMSEKDKRTFIEFWEGFMYANMLGAIKTSDVAFSSGVTGFLADELTSLAVQIGADFKNLVTGKSADFTNTRLFFDAIGNIAKNTSFKPYKIGQVFLGEKGLSVTDINNDKKNRFNSSLTGLKKLRILRDEAKKKGDKKSVVAYNSLIYHQVAARGLMVMDYVVQANGMPYKLHRNLADSSRAELVQEGYLNPKYSQIIDRVNSKLGTDAIDKQLQEEGFNKNGTKEEVEKYNNRRSEIIYEFLPDSSMDRVLAEDAMARIAFTGRLSGFSGRSVSAINSLVYKIGNAGKTFSTTGEDSYTTLAAATLTKMATSPFFGASFRVLQRTKNYTPFGLIQFKTIEQRQEKTKNFTPIKLFEEYRYYDLNTGKVEIVPASAHEKEIRYANAILPTILFSTLLLSMLDYDDENDEFKLADDTKYFYTTGYSPAMKRKIELSGETYEPYTVYERLPGGKFKRWYNYKENTALWPFAVIGRIQERLLFDVEESLPSGGFDQPIAKDPLKATELLGTSIRSFMAFSSQGSIESSIGTVGAVAPILEGGKGDDFAFKKMVSGLVRMNTPLSALEAELDNYYSLATGEGRKKGTTPATDIFDRMLLFNPLFDNYDYDVIGRKIVQQPYGPILTTGMTKAVDALTHADKEDPTMTDVEKVLLKYSDIDQIKFFHLKPIADTKYKQTIVELPEDPQQIYDVQFGAAKNKSIMLAEAAMGLNKLSKLELEKALKDINTKANQDAQNEYLKRILEANSLKGLLGKELKTTKANLVKKNIFIDKKGKIIKKKVPYLATYEGEGANE